MTKTTNVKRLTTSAIMLAMATVLALVCAYIPFLNLPFGGGFTIASMLPIVIISYMYGMKWGFFVKNKRGESVLNTKRLKAAIEQSGLTQPQVAKVLRMSERTFSEKMENGDFGLIDAEIMIALLKIKNPVEVFFSDE